MNMRLQVGQATSVGQVRTGNEDSLLCEPVDSPAAVQRGLFCAVADGMGGHAAGEVASSIAVQKARDVYYSAEAGSVDEALRIAIETANRAVYAEGAAKSGRDHMGSTMTAVVISNDRAVVGHVGDSRCYVVQGGQIHQLTRDHSWVAEEVEAGVLTPEEARVHPRRNIITRALGLRPEVEVDIYRATVGPGTQLVLCSDGLHGLVRDEEIVEHVTQRPPQQAVDALIELANQRGGPDNITAVVVRVMSQGEGNFDDEATTLPGLPRIGVAHFDEHETPPSGTPIIDSSPSAPPGSPPRTVSFDPPPVVAPDPPTAVPAPAGFPPAVRVSDAAIRRGPAATPKRRGPSTLLLVVLLLVVVGLGAVGLWLASRRAPAPESPAATVVAPPKAVEATTAPLPTTTPPTAAPPAIVTPTNVPAPPIVPTVAQPKPTPPVTAAPTPPSVLGTPDAPPLVTPGSPLVPVTPPVRSGEPPFPAPSTPGGIGISVPKPPVLRRSLVVTAERANIREQPREDARVVLQVSNGVILLSDRLVDDGSPIDGDRRWYSVTAPAPGYVHASVVREIGAGEGR